MTSGDGVHFVQSSVQRLEPGPPAAVVLAPPVRVSVSPSGEIALIVRMPLTPVIATGMPAARPEPAALPAVNVTVVAVRLKVPPARKRLVTATVEAKFVAASAGPLTSSVLPSPYVELSKPVIVHRPLRPSMETCWL